MDLCLIINMAFKCLTQIEIKYQHPSTDELGRHPSKSMFYVYRENIRTKTFKHNNEIDTNFNIIMKQ